jgi:hypothetical protein
MNRRDLLKAALPALAVASIPSAAAAIPAWAPFVIEDPANPGSYALCYPCDRVSHAGRYVLETGQIVRAENFHGLRVETATGWAEVSPGAFNATVVGRVASTHGRGADGWHITRKEA